MPLVQEGDGAVEGLADGEGGTPQAVALALSLKLIFPVLELEAKVLGELTGMVQAKDEGLLLGAVQHRSVGILGALWLDGEAGVEVGHEGGEEGVGGVDVRDLTQAQRLDQTVLQGLVGPLHAPLGLRGVGMNGGDVEGLDGAGKRGQRPVVLRVMDAEEAVLVRVEGHRAFVLLQIVL